jgi:hypothetical protein
MSLPTFSSTFLLGGSLLVAFTVLQSVWRYQRKLRQNGNTPGYKLIIANTRQIMAILPVIRIPFTDNWHFNIGLSWWATHGYEGRSSLWIQLCRLFTPTIAFKAYGQDIISAVSLSFKHIGFPSHHFKCRSPWMERRFAIL